MKINLDTSVVKTREQRLGTIIGWKTGKTSELSRDSAYTCAGCKGNGGKRLCEAIGPFTQGSSCSERMVECQAGEVRDAILIQHSPIGCGTSQIACNSIYRNGLANRKLPVENMKVINTNIKETDMVFGALKKLEQSIRDAWDRHHPKAIFIATSCATGIIGEDVDSVAGKLQEEFKIPIIPLYCEGFRSKHWSTGFDAAQHGILRQIVRKNPGKKQEDLVNVISLWGSDVFSPMLAELGLRVNYVMDLAKVSDLEQLSEAAATTSFCHTLSSYLAAGLEEKFGVPEVKAPQPYGIAGTDAWIRELARVTHREEKAEVYIEKEHKRIAPRLEQLRKLLKGKKGYAATGSAYSHGLIAVLKELGIQVDGSLVFHHDPIYDNNGPGKDSLKFLVDNYGDVNNFSVSNRQQYQFCILLKNIKPDFILIRHAGLASLASRMGIPAAPLGNEHHAVGYQGILNLGETILGILAHKKFHEDLAAHIKLPYTKWWLSQKDPYVLDTTKRKKSVL
ncbi:nitrogenase component 1 [Clostridium autoethanogenum]|uniref:Nitrogenase n=1 Tax=Clostridium autoethanogenum DSM 10061 TaxID=1341692 RepID=A0ABN4BBB3_9CLOT|nr:nitrogenase component 1 [Clostridium autoethanogenum]AGY74645.1 nitrogenase [Clostridium autoethanogenum DSM 10061]ALU34827.1 vnfN-like nitrogenase [Clostridium autoethanogenum DSM 10061]OVY51548.1 Nitrogenase molybdenum-iron protein alpha chain [Clostridium autoethanogenum]